MAVKMSIFFTDVEIRLSSPWAVNLGWNRSEMSDSHTVDAEALFGGQLLDEVHRNESSRPCCQIVREI